MYSIDTCATNEEPLNFLSLERLEAAGSGGAIGDERRTVHVNCQMPNHC